MKDYNFLEATIEKENFEAILQDCERYLQFLQQDIQALKEIENPKHAHMILARLLKDKIIEAVKTLN